MNLKISLLFAFLSLLFWNVPGATGVLGFVLVGALWLCYEFCSDWLYRSSRF